jgi:predicted membrane-bound spermidine synthase
MSRSAFYVLFTASGFAGLIYESIWTQYLKLFLGHAAYAQSLVLVAFMGGMAAGAGYCARLSARLANPLLGYALVEAGIGVLALVFHPAFVGLTDWSYASLLPALGNEWSALAAKLALSCLLILPQSVLLGMTFPLMSAGLARAHPAAQGEAVAMLYFTNSLGAAAGVLASGFVLIAWVGLPGTLRTAGILNVALAIAVWLAARPAHDAPLAAQAGRGARARLLLAVAFFTGLASFVYEISWIRMLSLVMGASTHSFEVMLSTFILGLALGGLAVRRQADRSGSPERLLGWVQIVMGLAALATLPVYDLTFSLMEALMNGLGRTPSGYLLFNLSGQSIAALVMLPATFCAGMTLPLITGALLRRGTGEAAIGRVYAANTLGAIAGVVLAVHVGLPFAGLKGTLIAGALVDIAAGLALLAVFAPRRLVAWSAALAATATLAVAAGVELDANKMTAGVFRHGELAASRDAKILFAKDGKTATVHLVQYSEAVSLRTNGKSDGSINPDPEGSRGTDEITMVLTGALPLALKPDAKSAAVIGIGTGLTTHTLLQSLAIERVETVEIEAVMAEAARGFMPRNSGAFADPRGAILIDDAKSFFSTRNRRYDLIVSEPSNPWVSGVSGLFTREFYRRIRGHLEAGGVLVQWMQLYEMDASLVATVLRALGEEFAHYAVFAASDHDLLIVAGEKPLPLPARAEVFEHPGVAKELWTVHMLSAGDFDARYIGSRRTLEPLVASYGVPANSDFAPVLDLNAARQRFMERNAMELVGLLNLDVPLLELLEPARSRRPVNPLYRGAYAFERFENTRLAWYARDFLVGSRIPAPERVPASLQKDLELVKLRLLECREPRDFDVWLTSALRVARAVNPYLAPDDAGALWHEVMARPCFAGLQEFQRRWLALFRAGAARDGARMAEHAARLLATQPALGTEAREYLLLAGMSGHLAVGNREAALELWRAHQEEIRAPEAAAFRLLRCHAERSSCEAEFRRYNVPLR